MFAKKMTELYEMDFEICRLEHEVQNLEAAWHKVAGQRILIIEQLADLENFSVAGIIAWLRGKRAAQIEQLRRDLRNAESAVARERWQLDNVKQELQKLQLERENQPGQEEIQRWVQEDSNLLPLYGQLESKLCMAVLPTLLQKNLEGLMELHGFLRGERAGEIMTFEAQQQIYAQPDQYGLQCATWLQRLQKGRECLGQTLEIPPYYENPTGYIVSAAAQFNRIDRARNAIDQARAVKKTVDAMEKDGI